MSSAAPSTASVSAALVAGSTVAVTNPATGLCMTTSDPAFGQGAPVELAACGGAPTQTWTLTAAGQLTENNGQSCLDDYGFGGTPGTAVDAWPCNGGANQVWKVQSDGTIVSQSVGLCIDAQGGGTSAGTPLVLETCDDATSQQWS
jgi:endo-1,4-beta-xylanase